MVPKGETVMESPISHGHEFRFREFKQKRGWSDMQGLKASSSLGGESKLKEASLHKGREQLGATADLKSSGNCDRETDKEGHYWGVETLAVCARSDVMKLRLKEVSMSGWQERHWLLFVPRKGGVDLQEGPLASHWERSLGPGRALGELGERMSYLKEWEEGSHPHQNLLEPAFTEEQLLKD